MVTSRHRADVVVVLVLAATSVDGVSGIAVLPYPLFDRGSFMLPVLVARWSAGLALSWHVIALFSTSRGRHAGLCWHFLSRYRVCEDLGNGLRNVCWRSLGQ